MASNLLGLKRIITKWCILIVLGLAKVGPIWCLDSGAGAGLAGFLSHTTFSHHNLNGWSGSKVHSRMQPNDKVGLALIDDDSGAVAHANIVHRYQSIDLKQVIDSLLLFPADVKHPPTQEISPENQTDEDRSWIARFKDHIGQRIATADEYRIVVFRIQIWCKQHKKLERLDPAVSDRWHVALAEFTKVVAGIRAEKESSSANLQASSKWDSVLEALKRTVTGLEKKLIEEDTQNLLGEQVGDSQLDGNGMDRDETMNKVKSIVWDEAKSLLISTLGKMAKAVVLKRLAGYIATSGPEMSDSFMKYVGSKLFHIIGTTSASFAVNCLRDETTRTAFTLLDVVDPVSITTSLIKSAIG